MLKRQRNPNKGGKDFPIVGIFFLLKTAEATLATLRTNAKMENLPKEIILQIFSFLDLKSLGSTLLVCKRLSKLQWEYNLTLNLKEVRNIGKETLQKIFVHFPNLDVRAELFLTNFRKYLFLIETHCRCLH
jgi:hypothetical protein